MQTHGTVGISRVRLGQRTTGRSRCVTPCWLPDLRGSARPPPSTPALRSSASRLEWTDRRNISESERIKADLLCKYVKNLKYSSFPPNFYFLFFIHQVEKASVSVSRPKLFITFAAKTLYLFNLHKLFNYYDFENNFRATRKGQNCA